MHISHQNLTWFYGWSQLSAIIGVQISVWTVWATESTADKITRKSPFVFCVMSGLETWPCLILPPLNFDFSLNFVFVTLMYFYFIYLFSFIWFHSSTMNLGAVTKLKCFHGLKWGSGERSLLKINKQTNIIYNRILFSLCACGCIINLLCCIYEKHCNFEG